MSGTAIIRELLAQNTAVTSIVPADLASERLVVGALKQGVKIPAISVISVSSNEVWTSANNLTVKMVRERVQVTCFAPRAMDLERLVKACSLGRGMHTGNVKGYPVRSILRMEVGPYLPPNGDNIHEQSRDFMVTFMEAN
jgi:hypothetical protein